jgi:hypothetical protein
MMIFIITDLECLQVGEADRYMIIVTEFETPQWVLFVRYVLWTAADYGLVKLRSSEFNLVVVYQLKI